MTKYDRSIPAHRLCLEGFEQISARTGIPLLGTISQSDAVITACGLGLAIGEYLPANPVNRQYQELADAIVESVNEKDPCWEAQVA